MDAGAPLRSLAGPADCDYAGTRAYLRRGGLGTSAHSQVMGPAAQLDPRAPKAPDPLWAHLLKRTTEREVWEWANDPADMN